MTGPPRTDRPAPSRNPFRSLSRMRRVDQIVLAAPLVVAVAVGAALIGMDDAGRHARSLLQRLTGPERPVAAVSPSEPPDPWDGTLTLDDAQIAAMGVAFETVRPRTEPTYLEVAGATAYDPATLTKVRSRFNCLVNKVFVHIGSIVKKGDPLIELFSTDLAEAKSQYEEREAQWRHDKAQLDRLAPLYAQQAVSEREFFDAQNDEQKSRLEFKLARDDLIVFGLDEQEIAQMATEDGPHKAMLTLRSPVEGQVIDRAVVEGSLYDPTTILLMIAPTDRLWVLGNVYESDQNKVAVGQGWEIRFPFLPNVIEAKVEHIDSRIDPVNRTMPIRCTIANPEGRFKADMLVQSRVAIPPTAGQTVIPRTAVVFQEAVPYVYVRAQDGKNRIERREVLVSQEFHDEAILSRGLSPGEQVVTRGSLLCAQMFENQFMAARGTSP